MTGNDEVISFTEAVKQVEVAMSRVALLHLAFSEILVQELGKERGKELILKAIMEYGRKITEFVRKGGQDLPQFGITEKIGQDDAGHMVAYGCVLAKVFKQFDALELGSLYCYVDAAKSMASDPNRKLIHLTCETCGDDCCTFAILPTTQEERAAFQKGARNWRDVDPRLTKKP